MLIQRVRSLSVSDSVGRNDQEIGVQFPAVAGYFSPFQDLETDSRDHPASYAMGAHGFFAGVKLLIPDTMVSEIAVLTPYFPSFSLGQLVYRYAPHNDVSVNDVPHIRR